MEYKWGGGGSVAGKSKNTIKALPFGMELEGNGRVDLTVKV